MKFYRGNTNWRYREITLRNDFSADGMEEAKNSGNYSCIRGNQISGASESKLKERQTQGADWGEWEVYLGCNWVVTLRADGDEIGLG